MASNRGTFTRHPMDVGVFQTTDDPGDGGRLVYGQKRYIYSMRGRMLSFPRLSLPYRVDTIEDLATYGFIWGYDGSSRGYVQCVFCDFKIEDYNQAKRAAVEHMKGNPDCPLLKMQPCKNVTPTMTCNEGVKLQRQVFIPPDVISIVPHLKHPIIKNTIINVSPMGDIHLEYAYEHERIKSFRYDCGGLDVFPKDLARYGFHWLGGDEDVTMCTSCGLYVKNWQNGDLAAVIHSIFSPMCPFMKHLYELKDVYEAIG